MLAATEFAHKASHLVGMVHREEGTNMKTAFWLAGATVLALATPATAGDSIKIGFVSTFSPDRRDRQRHAKFVRAGARSHGPQDGGKPVEVIYEDDGQKPNVGKQKTEAGASGSVDFIAGYIWSNVLLASLKTAVDRKPS